MVNTNAAAPRTGPHRELVLYQRRETRDLLAKVHRLDAQPDLDAVVGGADHRRRSARAFEHGRAELLHRALGVLGDLDDG